MRSKYIVIEGWKAQAKLPRVMWWLRRLSNWVSATWFSLGNPGGTQLAEKLRSPVLDIKSVGDEVITDKAEVLMFYAARVQLVETVIKPALANGTG